MKRFLFLVASSALFLLGCGTEVDFQGETKSQLIKADTGGSISLDQRQTRLDIPANSLVEDTVVTLEVSSLDEFPKLDSVRNDVVNIEPAGLPLEVPATVTLDPGEPIKQDENFTVMQFTGQAWQTIEGAGLVSLGLVSVNISSLGALALVVEKEETPTGNQIEGTLTWPDESPIAEFPILLYQGESKLTETNTDGEGKFNFSDVAAGSYTLKSGPGAECPVSEDVTVTDEEKTVVSLVMCGG